MRTGLVAAEEHLIHRQSPEVPLPHGAGTAASRVQRVGVGRVLGYHVVASPAAVTGCHPLPACPASMARPGSRSAQLNTPAQAFVPMDYHLSQITMQPSQARGEGRRTPDPGPPQPQGRRRIADPARGLHAGMSPWRPCLPEGTSTCLPASPASAMWDGR